MMLPWVILAIMLAIGLAISVIYTAVVFFMHKYVVGGVLWLVLGLSSVGTYCLKNIVLNPYTIYRCHMSMGSCVGECWVPSLECGGSPVPLLKILVMLLRVPSGVLRKLLSLSSRK